MHQRTGLFDESPIERAHHTNNVYSRLFVNIKNWFDRQAAIEMRSHIADVPDVQKAVYGIEKKSSRESSEKAMERKVALNERKKAEERWHSCKNYWKITWMTKFLFQSILIFSANNLLGYTNSTRQLKEILKLRLWNKVLMLHNALSILYIGENEQKWLKKIFLVFFVKEQK